MKNSHLFLKNLNSFSLLLMAGFLIPHPSFAQIIPDRTLGSESSRISSETINGLPSERIEGGAIRGPNLFHSFQEFNINSGRGAYFTNPNGIANIFTRVTGGNASNILGTLGVLGTANLFFLNPSGIIFGPNARLDVRGSFFATSADSILFKNGFEFSSRNPQSPTLLAVNIPIGLNFRDNPGTIVNQSQITQPIQGKETPVGLAVAPGQTLALVGGNLNLTGNVTALQGNILLGSIASPGLVGFSLTPTGLLLDYTKIQNFGSIELSGTASATASGLGGGAIAVRGGTVTLRDRANLVSDTLGTLNGRDITVEASQLKVLDRAFISTSTIGTGTGGNLTVRATESVELKGLGFNNLRQNFLESVANRNVDPSFRESGLIIGTAGAGTGGNITIETKQLTVREGAMIHDPTFGIGTGGNIVIKASDSLNASESVIVAPTYNRGKGGNLTIETGTLTVQNGTLVSTSTIGAGNGGDIIVRASDSIVLSQSRADSPFGNGIGTNTVGSTGNAGNIDIHTKSLLVERGAKITSTSGYASVTGLIPATGQGGNVTITASDSVTVSSTLATDSTSRSLIVAGTTAGGQGGNVTINTRHLTVDGGSGIGANTLGTGNGGNVTINASESILLTGTSSDGSFPSGLATASGEPLFQALFKLTPTGAAGNISVTTPKLTVQDGATINVGSLGSGRAGNIEIVADAIALDRKGTIDGSTVSGTGANINIQAQSIQLRRNSQITTDAGSSDGGNLNLKSEILLALPQENSDITANARSARGGRVTVNVPNIFGFAAVGREQVRDRLGMTDAQFQALSVSPTSLLNTSDIAAISQAVGPQLQGTVTFSTAGVNPAQGLVVLPQTVIDPAQLIAANPCRGGEGSKFTVSGRGGLPPSPNSDLSSNSPEFKWVEPSETSNSATSIHPEQPIPNPKSVEVIPARGWIVTPTGDVQLVAYETNAAGSQRPWRSVSWCQSR
ncbi:MAG: filamentous hemagglutinin N-terminal domain-containing protein [Actinomycetota bacterium]